MSHRVTFKLLSLILFALTGMFLIGLLVAKIEEPSREILAKWSFCATVSSLLATAFYLKGPRQLTKIFHREALAFVGLGWIITILLGVLPYLLLVPSLSFADALFESCSGFTSTGSTILANIETLPRSLLVFRALSQWIGGIGIIIFFVAFFSDLGPASKILFSGESTQNSDDLNFERIQRATVSILIIYAVLTCCCGLIYAILGMPPFDAFCHALTTLSTGGMSTRSAGFLSFQQPSMQWVAIFFMFLGSINFYVLIQFLRRDWIQIRRNTEWKMFLFLILFFTGCVMILQLPSAWAEPLDCFRRSLFNVLSCMTTTGYAASDFELWLPSTQLLLLLASAIGGCSGSSAGGIKVLRIAMGLKMVRQILEKTFRPRLVRPLYVNGHSVSETAQNQFVSYILLTALVLLFLFPIYLLIEPKLTTLGSFSSFFAAFFNVGCGLGEFGPSHTFASLSSLGKFFLAFLMLLGRLEMYAVLVLFLPSFWKRFN